MSRLNPRGDYDHSEIKTEQRVHALVDEYPCPEHAEEVEQAKVNCFRASITGNIGVYMLTPRGYPPRHTLTVFKALLLQKLNCLK